MCSDEINIINTSSIFAQNTNICKLFVASKILLHLWFSIYGKPEYNDPPLSVWFFNFLMVLPVALQRSILSIIFRKGVNIVEKIPLLFIRLLFRQIGNLFLYLQQSKIFNLFCIQSKCSSFFFYNSIYRFHYKTHRIY